MLVNEWMSGAAVGREVCRPVSLSCTIWSGAAHNYPSHTGQANMVTRIRNLGLPLLISGLVGVVSPPCDLYLNFWVVCLQYE
jgi:hypothetical protein